VAQSLQTTIFPTHPELSLPMGEVHPGNVHPVLDELEEDLRTAAGGSNGANNTRKTHPDVKNFYEVGIGT